MKKPEGFFTNLGFEISGAGLVVTNRRVGMTEPGVKNSTQGLENPGVGLEKPRPSPVTPKAGLKKREGGVGCGLLPFVTTKVSIRTRNSKSAFSILTFSPPHFQARGHPGRRAGTVSRLLTDQTRKG